MRKKKLSFIVALWWVILCLVLGVLILMVSHKDSRFSESENRMLAPFPALSLHSLFSGEFMTGFDDYLSDAFFARDGVTSFTTRFLDFFSVLSRDEKMLQKTQAMEGRLAQEGDMQADNKGEAPAPDAPAEPTPPPIEEGEAIVIADATTESDDEEETAAVVVPAGEIPLTEENSYLWLTQLDGTPKIIYTYENARIATYAETLRMIQGILPADGCIFVTQVPLAAIGNRWTDQQHVYCGWGSSVETVLERELQGTERIYVYNTWDTLAPYMPGDTPMFYHTDHHWSAEAAYILCAEMLKTQNLPVISYDEYQYKAITSKRNDEGQTDVFNVLYQLLPAHSYVVTHRDELQELNLMNYKSTTYTSYMNNSRQPWRRIVTGANTGRRALVICDSFGNAFTPYLLPYYDEVHMTDFRYGYYDKAEAGGSMSEMCAYYGIDDIYLIFSTANGLRKDNSIVYLRQYFFE